MWTEQRRQTLWNVFADMGKSQLLEAAAILFTTHPLSGRENGTTLASIPESKSRTVVAPTMRRFFYVDEVLHLRNIGSYVGQGHIEDLDTRWMDLADAGEPPAGGR